MVHNKHKDLFFMATGAKVVGLGFLVRGRGKRVLLIGSGLALLTYGALGRMAERVARRQEKEAGPTEIPAQRPGSVRQPTPHQKRDDLTLIRGIGPKIEKLLNDQGLVSYAQLSMASIQHLKEILEAAQVHPASHDPSTWPVQAALAAAGQFEELKDYQEKIRRREQEDTSGKNS